MSDAAVKLQPEAQEEELTAEDDNATYRVGEDGELIKEHTPNTDEDPGDENDSEDKTDEEK